MEKRLIQEELDLVTYPSLTNAKGRREFKSNKRDKLMKLRNLFDRDIAMVDVELELNWSPTDHIYKLRGVIHFVYK